MPKSTFLSLILLILLLSCLAYISLVALPQKNALNIQRVSLQSEIHHLQLEIKILKEQQILAQSEQASSFEKVSVENKTEKVDQKKIKELAIRWGISEPNYDEAMLRLSSAGFNAFDAERIFEIESASKYQLLETLSDPALRNQKTTINAIRDFSNTLRKEIGDYGYEAYLKSAGHPNTVNIVNVSENSTAKNAGLKVGDQITHYDGERVFNIFDINDLTQQGSKGELITIEFIRDRQLQTATLARGTMGIMSRPPELRSFFNNSEEP